ncbi:hypothetical protein Dimus_038068 [Dionaea muscipula]
MVPLSLLSWIFVAGSSSKHKSNPNLHRLLYAAFDANLYPNLIFYTRSCTDLYQFPLRYTISSNPNVYHVLCIIKTYYLSYYLSYSPFLMMSELT